MTNPDFSKIRERFGVVKSNFDLVPRYNIAPMQEVAVVFNDSPTELNSARWGIPDWEGRPHFNARAESVEKLMLFRDSFSKRRCLMLADGFYEWKEKRPFRFTTGSIFAFAGIYNENEGKRCCALLTTEASSYVMPVHDRMPVILGDSSYLEKRGLLKPYKGPLDCVELSKDINSSRADNPDLIRPKKSLLDF